MEITRSGKMYISNYERYIVITIDDKVITRKVLKYDDEKNMCDIRYNKQIISVPYHW